MFDYLEWKAILSQTIQAANVEVTAAQSSFDDAVAAFMQPDWHPCVAHIISGCMELTAAMGYTVANIDPQSCLNQVIDLAVGLDGDFSEIGESLPVTYKTIAEAWGVDDFKGRNVTIAFIDRMRQLLWDEEYFVAWAARPEQSIEGPR